MKDVVCNVKTVKTLMKLESIAGTMWVSTMLQESANQLSNYHILRFVQKNEL